MTDKPRSVFGRAFRLLWMLVSGFLRLLVIVAVVVSLASWWFVLRGGDQVAMENNMPLVLAPTGKLVDAIDEDPAQRFFERLNGDPASQSSLRDLIKAIDFAREDKRVPFAVLKLDGMTGAGLPQIEELNAALRAFRASGKKLIAWGPYYDQPAYLAAAQADEIVLDPWGSVNIEGFSTYNNYFKDALDKLKIDINVFRVGAYKSAVEPFTRNDMSPEARAANQQWLGDLWGFYGRRLAAARELPATVADDYVRKLPEAMVSLKGDAAAYAKQSGLVTQIETQSAFRRRVGAEVGMDDDLGSFRQIYYLDYLAAVKQEGRKQNQAKPARRIVIVNVQGEIVDGRGDTGQAGGDTISELLDEARRDNDIAAVVLRVNSPGGSVWASEQIRRAVADLQADGKPVVASMSSVAASGGYWVSMDANRIFAHEATITGSIGIFGMIPTVDRALGHLGVHTDGVGTTALAGSQRLDRPLSLELRRIIQAQVDKGYRDFIEHVASARKMPVDKVDEIAQGRVWSGQRALRLGLVDEIGGLPEAAAAAATIAGLKEGDYRLETMYGERGFADQLLSQLSGQWQAHTLPPWLTTMLLGRVVPLPQQLDAERWLARFNDPRGLYARCFCEPGPGGR